MTTREAVRAYCLGCCAGKAHEVKLCVSVSCPLHQLRLSFKQPDPPDTPIHPLEHCKCAGDVLTSVTKAVELRCLDCSGYSRYEVKNCRFTGCPLFEYRSTAVRRSWHHRRAKP